MANQMSSVAARTAYKAARRRRQAVQFRQFHAALGGESDIDGRAALLELCGNDMDPALRAKLERELAAERRDDDADD